MWLNRGALDGVRLLSPALVELATAIHTGDMEDRLIKPIRVAKQWPHAPTNRGLSLWIRGRGIFPTYFGTLTPLGMYGHAGVSSIMAWADPSARPNLRRPDKRPYRRAAQHSELVNVVTSHVKLALANVSAVLSLGVVPIRFDFMGGKHPITDNVTPDGDPDEDVAAGGVHLLKIYQENFP